MKRTLLSTLVACLVLLASPAAAQSWTKIEAQADVIPGSTYIITFTNDEGYYHTLLLKKDDEAYKLLSNSYFDKTYSTVESLVDNTTLFTIEQNQGTLYLYSQKEQKYLATINGNTAYFKAQLVETLEEASPLTFERTNDVLELKLSDRYLQHQPAASDYRLNSSNKSTKSSKVNVLLYRYDTGDAPTTKTYTLSTDEDLGVSDVYGNVSFVRTFKDDYYNTLILPFKIEDYKSVFGINVSAYELQKVDHNTLTFKAVETNELKADTHYLLKGKFKPGPYEIKNVYIKDNSTDGIIKYTRGNITFHGLYKHKAVGQSSAFILWQESFYPCTNIPSLTVEPYKWYLTTTNPVESIPAKFTAPR